MLLENIADDRAVIAHADADQDAENLKEQLLADGRVKEVLIEPLGPVIATHVGPGTLALFGFAKKKRPRLRNKLENENKLKVKYFRQDIDFGLKIWYDSRRYCLPICKGPEPFK